MPSVRQGQGMRTLSEQRLSVVSWIKFRNLRLGQLLFKLVQSPVWLWTKSHFLGYHTCEDLELALCHYQPKDHRQLLQHIPVRAKGSAGRSCLVRICGEWILRIPSTDSPSDEWATENPKSKPDKALWTEPGRKIALLAPTTTFLCLLLETVVASKDPSWWYTS